MNENSDFDGEDQSEEAVEDSPLRIDETDAPKDGGEKQRSPKSKKSKATLNYGIVAAILILGSVVVPVFIKDWDFAITPFSVGVTILGITYYSWKRKRDCSDKGIIFYSHSQIMYLWPIWLGAFVISDIIGFLPGLSRALGGKSFALPEVTLFHLVVMAIVIFFTSVNLRGVWAVVFAVSAARLTETSLTPLIFMIAFSIWDTQAVHVIPSMPTVNDVVCIPYPAFVKVDSIRANAGS